MCNCAGVAKPTWWLLKFFVKFRLVLSWTNFPYSFSLVVVKWSSTLASNDLLESHTGFVMWSCHQSKIYLPLYRHMVYQCKLYQDKCSTKQAWKWNVAGNYYSSMRAICYSQWVTNENKKKKNDDVVFNEPYIVRYNL